LRGPATSPVKIEIGLSRLAGRLFGPIFLAYRQVALFAWVPLLTMWFGCSETGKLAFIALAAFAPSAVNSWRGARSIPQSYRELSAVQTFGWLDHLRLATVGAELFLDIAPGLAGRLNEGREKFEVDLMIVALMVLATLGLVFGWLAALIETRLIAWRRA
jgi:sulfonate transport system permease protein